MSVWRGIMNYRLSSSRVVSSGCIRTVFRRNRSLFHPSLTSSSYHFYTRKIGLSSGAARCTLLHSRSRQRLKIWKTTHPAGGLILRAPFSPGHFKVLWPIPSHASPCACLGVLAVATPTRIYCGQMAAHFRQERREAPVFYVRPRHLGKSPLRS